MLRKAWTLANMPVGMCGAARAGLQGQAMEGDKAIPPPVPCSDCAASVKSPQHQARSTSGCMELC